ncbi:MAG: hypothetical protein AAF518_21550 [Spirochaetota bacterium]
MRYIYPCPQCNTELRFPLDRGTLVIKCPTCSHTFIVDPDNTELFEKGRFEFPGKRLFHQKSTSANPKDTLSLGQRLAGVDIKRVVTIVLFSVLFLYILKNYSIGTNTPRETQQIDSPPQEKQISPPDKEPQFSI